MRYVFDLSISRLHYCMQQRMEEPVLWKFSWRMVLIFMQKMFEFDFNFVNHSCLFVVFLSSWLSLFWLIFFQQNNVSWISFPLSLIFVWMSTMLSSFWILFPNCQSQTYFFHFFLFFPGFLFQFSSVYNHLFLRGYWKYFHLLKRKKKMREKERLDGGRERREISWWLMNIEM